MFWISSNVRWCLISLNLNLIWLYWLPLSQEHCRSHVLGLPKYCKNPWSFYLGFLECSFSTWFLLEGSLYPVKSPSYVEVWQEGQLIFHADPVENFQQHEILDDSNPRCLWLQLYKKSLVKTNYLSPDNPPKTITLTTKSHVTYSFLGLCGMLP